MHFDGSRSGVTWGGDGFRGLRRRRGFNRCRVIVVLESKGRDGDIFFSKNEPRQKRLAGKGRQRGGLWRRCGCNHGEDLGGDLGLRGRGWRTRLLRWTVAKDSVHCSTGDMKVV